MSKHSLFRKKRNLYIDFLTYMQIASAKFWSAKGTSCEYVFMAAQLLVTTISPFCQVDEFIFLFFVKSKVSSFLFLVLIKGMWRRVESEISLCSPRGYKLLQSFSCNTYSPITSLLTIVSQAPLGYIMVVYFDSIVLFQ